MKPRKIVQWFALLMEQKLDENKHKNGWRQSLNTRLLRQLKGEVQELEEALLNGDPVEIAREAADVANYAMMLADNAQRERRAPLTRCFF